MADPFVAEIRLFPFNFAPKGWAFCDGQLLPISQNTALFSLLGTTYGGDGKSNFALPDLQDRSPLHPGQGPGLSERVLGEQGGESSVTLLRHEMPSHTHPAVAAAEAGTTSAPAGTAWAIPSSGRTQEKAYATGGTVVNLGPTALAEAGGGQPHNNMPPYLTLNFCIALQGVFPQRP